MAKIDELAQGFTAVLEHTPQHLRNQCIQHFTSLHGHMPASDVCAAVEAHKSGVLSDRDLGRMDTAFGWGLFEMEEEF